MKFEHLSVLAKPTVMALTDPHFSVKQRRNGSVSVANKNYDLSDGVFVDGTFGRGGHSRLLLKHLAPTARLLVFDKDPEAIKVANELAAEDSRVTVIHAGFSSLQQQLKVLGIKYINGIMLDLGVSSPQIDSAERGFSFMRDGPLDMRMDTSSGITAAQWLAEVSLKDLQEVIAKYGEERFAFQIAKAVVSSRESAPLCTTLDLAELVASVVRTREKGQHPATRTFQAIRIHINQELQELAHALEALLKVLDTGGRMAVISFHSLEDRMVKQCIASAARPGAAYARLPILEKDMPKPILKSLGKYVADTDEVSANPRARSAVLRVAERTKHPITEVLYGAH